MVSFDLKLFTSVPLTETIDIILDCIYNHKEISTVLTKMKYQKHISKSMMKSMFKIRGLLWDLL